MSHTKEPWKEKVYADRFWSRVEIGGSDECWGWKRGVTKDGYGVFHFGNSSIRAHRFSYQQHNGSIGEYECVCHSCDNPRCVNPSHLWLGTRAENNADKEAKGRSVHPKQGFGESNSYASLTTPEVMAARVMTRNGMPQSRVASFLGVSAATICMIVGGERRADETEKRVSACVNACAGIPTESLELGLIDMMSVDAARANSRAWQAKSLKAEQQRDQLQRENDILRGQLASCKSDLATACTLASKSAEQAQAFGAALEEAQKVPAGYWEDKQ